MTHTIPPAAAMPATQSCMQAHLECISLSCFANFWLLYSISFSFRVALLGINVYFTERNVLYENKLLTTTWL